jgi:membrane dipeptidase
VPGATLGWGAVMLRITALLCLGMVSPSMALAHILTLDTHLDTPYQSGRPGWSILDRHTYEDDLSQVDYPRMLEGGLDGGFWVIYTAQGPLTAQGYAAARDAALLRAVQIREMVAHNSDRFALALTAEDASRIVAAHKVVVYQSIENSYPLGRDLTLLDTFFKLGVRMIGPVHSQSNQFADSATSAAKWGGLSPLGRQLVERANELGIILDASHASDAAFDQMLSLSRTPVVLSHSGVRALLDHPRNIDDARLRRLAAAGGVVQVAAASDFIVRTEPDAAREALEAELEERLPTYTGAQAADLAARIRRIEAAHHIPRADFEGFVRQVLHAISVAGIDHVGIGADWDGGGGVTGFNDVADLPKLLKRLRQAGYSDADISKVMSGNILRVLGQVQEYATHARAPASTTASQ